MGPEDLQVVKYTEATTLSDWAFAHKAPPTGCLSYTPCTEATRGAKQPHHQPQQKEHP